MNPTRRKVLQMLPILASMGPAAAAPVNQGRMPVLFLGHGSPMNAIAGNEDYAMTLSKVGMMLRRPKAILVVSAHWQTDWVTKVLAAPQPPTIHDFVGFPPELYDVNYPAPGAPELAARTCRLIGPAAQLTSEGGLDHGAWSVLCHLYPRANIPVFQLSLDMMQSGRYHWETGKMLAPLRDEGVLIIGSGNIVHNTWKTEPGLSPGRQASRRWAHVFDAAVVNALNQRDDTVLQNVQVLPYASDAVPSADHFWPLLYALGAAHDAGAPRTIFQGFESGTISMRCLQFGG